MATLDVPSAFGGRPRVRGSWRFGALLLLSASLHAALLLMLARHLGPPASSDERERPGAPTGRAQAMATPVTMLRAAPAEAPASGPLPSSPFLATAIERPTHGPDAPERSRHPRERPGPRPMASSATATRAASAAPPRAPRADDADSGRSGDHAADRSGERAGEAAGVVTGAPGALATDPGAPGPTSLAATGDGARTAPIRPTNVPHEPDLSHYLARPEPHVPDLVRLSRRGSEATVMAVLCVARTGHVSTVRLLRGIPGADDEIKRTLSDWRLRPQPIPICYPVSIVYRFE